MPADIYSNRKAKVLVVDDNKTNLQVVVPILMESGNYSINVALNGTQALEMADKIRPDIMLLDIMMPDINGFEVCQQLRAKKEFEDMPIIFVSAKNEIDDITRSFEVGGSDYVTKPFNRQELLARIHTHVELRFRREELEDIISDKSKALQVESAKRLQLQEHVNHMRKLESLGQLAGGIAHDFNNQLGGIIGCAEMIRMLKENPEKCDHFSNMIIKSVHNADKLIKQLLFFARKNPQNMSPCDLKKILNELCSFLAHSLDKKVTIDYTPPQDIYYTIGDSAQIYNSLLNIAINASHAMANEGKINISLSERTVTDELRDQMILKVDNAHTMTCITISDKGSGFSKEMIPRIFEPFFTTKPVDKGTGLGLAAVWGIMQEHKGGILVESTPEQGSSFSLFFEPSAESAQAPQEAPQASSLKGVRVLYADDDPMMREVLQQILSIAEAEITLAVNGKDALELYNKQPDEYDLVILDNIMPELSGIEVAHSIREAKDMTPILLVSGYFGTDNIIEESEISFIKKPFSTKNLMAAINKTMDTQK